MYNSLNLIIIISRESLGFKRIRITKFIKPQKKIEIYFNNKKINKYHNPWEAGNYSTAELSRAETRDRNKIFTFLWQHFKKRKESMIKEFYTVSIEFRCSLNFYLFIFFINNFSHQISANQICRLLHIQFCNTQQNFSPFLVAK